MDPWHHRQRRRLLNCLVDLIGIEPMTSSMPWKVQRVDLLTAKDL